MAKKKKTANDTRKENAPLDQPLPDRRMMERAMREIAGNLGGKTRSPTALDRAQELIDQAFEAPDAEQVRIARKALEISPDCADAYTVLAEHAETADEALELYQQAVVAGERALGKEGFKEFAGHFWGFLETRPYMRAREGLAQFLWESGQWDDAAQHYQEMLRLNPNDNQGARYRLATLLLDLDRDEELQQLLKQYEEEISAEWHYARALLAFRKEGESAEANQLLVKAAKANKYVPAYLLGNKPLPSEMPPYISIGDETEAVSYVYGNRRVWLNTSGAISWVRNTLKVPMPAAPKRRRPSWPQLRLMLLRLPQERGEVWQMDVYPSPKETPANPAGKQSWTMVIVSQASHELLGLEVSEKQPNSGEVWDRLTDAMRQPPHSEAHRPAAVQMRPKTFPATWKAKLKQIGVDCMLSDTLEAIDVVREPLSSSAAGAPVAANSEPDDMLTVPQEPSDVWQVDVRAMPAWITGEGQPYRAWIALVVSRTEETVLSHQVSKERHPVDCLWEVVAQAIRQPLAGNPHRPGAVEVASAEQRESLLPYLGRIGVECVEAGQLDGLDLLLEDMATHVAGPGAPASLLEVPGMEPAQVGGFYAAAAEFYRRKPWQHVAGDTLIKVECDKFHSGPWYAVVMGQSGVQQGLAVYEDLAAVQATITGDASEEEHARGMSAISLMFSEAFEMPFGDVDAAEKHGWPVAGPEAYPLIVRINPGLAMRPPLAWELELLEGCLRTIPDFLETPNFTSSPPPSLTSCELKLRLSRVG